MPTSGLKILLVDETEQRARALRSVLVECGYRVDFVCDDGRADLFASVRACEPELILIAVDSPGRDTLEQLTIIKRERPRPVVMFTQDDNAQTISAAIDSGVSAYIVDGISAARVRPIIDVAMATFRAYQNIRSELEQTRSALRDRDVVDFAKRLLMKCHNWDEEEAYHYLRRLSMNRCCKLSDVAHEVAMLYKNNGGL